MKTKLTSVLVVAALASASVHAADEPAGPSRLEFREILTVGSGTFKDDNTIIPKDIPTPTPIHPPLATPTPGGEKTIAPKGIAIPRDAVQVFTYEAESKGVFVGPERIAVDYGQSGVLFDRKTGRVAGRRTIANGWPEVRPGEFPPPRQQYIPRLVGPGVLDAPGKPDLKTKPDWEYLPAVTIEFNGQTWQAMQPAGFLNSEKRRSRNKTERNENWTTILRELNDLAYLETKPKGGGAAVHHTMKECLASNIITHLVVAEGKLWAACVDIYDPDKKEWGPGGLCVFDPKVARWQRIDRIDDRPVRWVTLMQTVGDSLWVAFREGDGVEGDYTRIEHGKGDGIPHGKNEIPHGKPGQYGPVTKTVVLARLAGGKWKAYARTPLPSPPFSTDVPRSLALAGQKLFLLSQTLVPTKKPGQWVVSPLHSGRNAIVQTPRAVWIVSPGGQLIRLDRDKLSEWLEWK